MNEIEIKLEEVITCEYDCGSKDDRMDAIWYMLNNFKSPVGNNLFTVSSGQVNFNHAAFKRLNWKGLFLGEQE